MANDVVATIEGDIWSVQDRFSAICADKSLNFEREANFAMQVLFASDYAMNTAMKNRQSVIDAVTNIAAVGISLNPAKKQAYLVPRDGRICLDISYMGLMDLAMEGGSIRWAQCQLVHEKDSFILNGLDKQPTHSFNPFAKDRGPIVGVYCTVKTSDGDYLTHCMQIEDVYAIRDRSSAWKAFQAKKARSPGPWGTDEAEMIRKTCVKQAYKYWPKTDRLEAAIHHVNVEGEGIDFDAERGAQKATGVIGSGKPTDGSMESLDIETQNYLRELGSDCEALFDEHGVSACFDRIAADQLDVEQKIALWTLLRSDIRSALKKEGEARREAETAIP